MRQNQLLIEPVWNRNKGETSKQQCKQGLLIEPVWNRNSIKYRKKLERERAFNRTSMESKRVVSYDPETPYETFNRTSMESKRGYYPFLTYRS